MFLAKSCNCCSDSGTPARCNGSRKASASAADPLPLILYLPPVWTPRAELRASKMVCRVAAKAFWSF